MTTAGNGHVSLNGVKYLLDEEAQDHYVHRMPGLFPHFFTYENIQGSTEKNVKTNRLLWSMSDWVGGEGNRVFYDDEPNVYDYGINTNPRIPGQVTGRPKRFRATVPLGTDSQGNASTGAITQSHYGRFADGGGTLFYFVDNKVFKAVDGALGVAATWTNVSPTMESTSAFTAACGDSSYIYASAWKDDGSGTTAERTTMYSPDAGTTWQNLTTAETINGSDTGEASKNAIYDMCIHNGRLFTWTGKKLTTWDVASLTGSNALTSDQYRKVYDTGVEPTRVFGNSFWAGIVDCGTAVCFFQSVVGRGQVYMYQQGVARPIWTKPGFTIKGIAYNGGSIYVTGTFAAGAGSNNPGHGAIYQIPLDSLREIFLKWVRKTVDTNLQMQVAGAAVGDRITVCAAHTGRIWTYDGDYNGFSMLDDLAGNDSSTQLTAAESSDGGGGSLSFTANSHRIADVYSWGPYVYAGIYRPGATGETVNQIVAYCNDEPAQRNTLSTDATASTPSEFIISPEHDMDYPNDAKILVGFHVSYLVEASTTTVRGDGTTSGLLANQQIRIQYALDYGQSPTWTTAATITQNTAVPTGGVRGRVFIDMTGTTTKFYRLRWRAVFGNTSTAGVQPPILLDVTVESEISANDEFYDLILRIEDEEGKTRTSKAMRKANILRDNLVTLRRNKTIFAFIDGYIYREEGKAAASQRVWIDNLEDNIGHNAEGTMKVTLRVVPT